MLERIAETIHRYNMFAPGHRVGVAVSGGADSVCLLHVLLKLAPHWALRLRVMHLNHRLRGQESDQDAEFVRNMAEQLGLEADIESADVPALHARQGGNLEQLARQVRRDFFVRRIREGAVDRVAAGHTLSDQAETVLFRILRGCGLRGLGGIWPVTPEGIVRPLIETDRPAVVSYLRERGIRWREDSSNRDLRFARNRIRLELLPKLSREWNPALTEALGRLAELAREEEQHGEREALSLAQQLVKWEGGAALIRAPDLVSLDRPAARRLLRLLSERLRGDLRRIEFRHVQGILDLARQPRGEGGLDLPELHVRRSFDWIRLSLPVAPGETRPDGAIAATAIEPPTQIVLPGGTRSLHFELSEGGEAGAQGAVLDWERLPKPLMLRGWKPGDRFRPAGSARQVSLKELFQKYRTPSWERPHWPVLEGGRSIVWVWRFGPAAEFLPGEDCRWRLRIEERQKSI